MHQQERTCEEEMLRVDDRAEPFSRQRQRRRHHEVYRRVLAPQGECTGKLCIAGIVKESISNAVKHSTGDRIFISVREHPAFYQLQVEDNGACKELADTGIGLKNMRDRAESLRGVISFTPSETGFRVFASLPKN